MEKTKKNYYAPACRIIPLDIKDSLMVTVSQAGNPGFGSRSSSTDFDCYEEPEDQTLSNDLTW
ncbi:MAG TPA: hypothetical protein H9972_03280 [Candidatus Paraprevotella stercorigallinarum]|mgnify:CR=1|nr:hypothetical protein [Candidatus Paraprevotella stercorigallinarum]